MKKISGITFLICAGFVIIREYYGDCNPTLIIGWVTASVWCINATWFGGN